MSTSEPPGSPMDSERFRQIKDALLRARELPGPERAAYLDEVGASDPGLRREVESLLEAGERPAPIVDEGPLGAISELSAPPRSMPERIGPYRLREVLGVGGMGIVYRAEQETPIRREVALKVIRGGLDSGWVMSRFEVERQSLALMNHPNIARVFDAGADELDRPYFAMELVPGVPITDHCDAQRLDTHARLDLFLKLCEAIQHAHQKGVIHRDLKPSNVLVSSQDGASDLKVIDFGIAKALEPGSPAEASATETGQFVGTPSYMSPEQSGAISEPVDTRSDVYALGVMLYELLCGARPFEWADRGWSQLDLRRSMRDQEPQRPSTRVPATGGGRDAGNTVANTRATTTEKLRRQLAGDLDNIVLMALRREPSRRYASVERFASDIRRHLDGLPVAARPDTWRYRSSKFVRRHRAGVAVAAALLVIVAVFVVALAIQSGRLADERNRAVAAEREARSNAARAREEAATSKETAEFLAGLFEASNPDVARGREMTARELLDVGARRVNEELVDQPALRARLLTTLGGVYHSLADLPRGQALAESALALQRRLPSPRDEDLASTLSLLSDLAHDQRDMPRSASYSREEIEIRRRLLGNRHPDLATSLNDLAVSLRAMGQFAAAESLLREALAIHRETLDSTDSEIAWDLGMLGYVRNSRGDLADAERLFREALAILRRTIEPPNSELAGSLNNLGSVLVARGRTAEAESTLRDALRMYQALYQDDHPAVARAYHNLGLALRDAGRAGEAESLFRRSLALHVRLQGREHEYVAIGLSSLGASRRDRGDFEGADSCFARSLAIRRRVFGDEHAEVHAVELARGELALDAGRLADAERLTRHALAGLEATRPPGEARLMRAKFVLGATLVEAGRASEAQPLLRATFDDLSRSLPAGHWRIDEARSALGGCLLALGRTSEARPMLERGAAGLARALGESDVRAKLAARRLSRAAR